MSNRVDHQHLIEPLNVVLVAPEIAANTGNIGRTCVALGASLWLVRPLGFHLTDRHLRRAGLDYWQHLNVRVVDDLRELTERMGHRRVWLFSTRGLTPNHAASFSPGDALVFGSEGHGLPEAIRSEFADRVLRIPMAPEARSLNLACAVAVGLFEAQRQIGFRA